MTELDEYMATVRCKFYKEDRVKCSQIENDREKDEYLGRMVQKYNFFSLGPMTPDVNHLRGTKYYKSVRAIIKKEYSITFMLEGYSMTDVWEPTVGSLNVIHGAPDFKKYPPYTCSATPQILLDAQKKTYGVAKSQAITGNAERYLYLMLDLDQIALSRKKNHNGLNTIKNIKDEVEKVLKECLSYKNAKYPKKPREKTNNLNIWLVYDLFTGCNKKYAGQTKNAVVERIGRLLYPEGYTEEGREAYLTKDVFNKRIYDAFNKAIRYIKIVESRLSTI